MQHTHMYHDIELISIQIMTSQALPGIAYKESNKLAITVAS